MPELPDDLLWVYHSFSELARRRPHDQMGNPLYIAITEITAYAKHVLQLSKRMMPIYVAMIGRVDTAVLGAHYAKVAEERERKKREKRK